MVDRELAAVVVAFSEGVSRSRLPDDRMLAREYLAQLASVLAATTIGSDPAAFIDTFERLLSQTRFVDDAPFREALGRWEVYRSRHQRGSLHRGEVAPRLRFWYVAVLVLEVTLDEDSSRSLTDLQVRLISASSDEYAYRRALQLGEGENHSYRNSDGQPVSWRCTGLRDLRRLDAEDFEDGLEVVNLMTGEQASALALPKERLSCFWTGGGG